MKYTIFENHTTVHGLLIQTLAGESDSLFHQKYRKVYRLVQKKGTVFNDHLTCLCTVYGVDVPQAWFVNGFCGTATPSTVHK